MTPGCSPGRRRRAGTASQRWSSTPAGSRRTSGRPCVRHEAVAPVRDLDLAVGQDARRLRAEPRRLGARRGPGRGRHRDHRPPRRGAGARRARHAAAAQRRGTDRFILSGGEDVFEPTLTFHGFRYAEVDRLAGRADPRTPWRRSSSHSDLRRIGTSSAPTRCSTSCTSNVVWGMRGNFLDVPTDCPQRDERLGWTGDLAVFAPTAAFLYDADAFLRDWLARPGRRAGGARRHRPARRPGRPEVRRRARPISRIRRPPRSGATRRCGCPGRCGRPTATGASCEDQYPSMAAHVRRVESLLSPTGLWDTGFQFGDWLDPHAPPDEPVQGQGRRRASWPPPAATGPRAPSRDAARAAGPGRRRRALPAAGRAGPGGVQRALRRRGRDGAQRLRHGLRAGHRVRPARRRRRPRAGDRLAEPWSARTATAISTGFAGTPYVTDALTRTGHLDDAYRLLLERELPVLAVPGHDGSHHDLGALGLDAARRHASTRAR